MSPKSSAIAAVHSFLHPQQPAEPAQPGLLAHERERAQAIAYEQGKLVQKESRQNVELIWLSNEIVGLTKEVHDLATAFAKPANRQHGGVAWQPAGTASADRSTGTDTT